MCSARGPVPVPRWEPVPAPSSHRGSSCRCCRCRLSHKSCRIRPHRRFHRYCSSGSSFGSIAAARTADGNRNGPLRPGRAGRIPRTEPPSGRSSQRFSFVPSLNSFILGTWICNVRPPRRSNGVGNNCYEGRGTSRASRAERPRAIEDVVKNRGTRQSAGFRLRSRER
jgi:hypothetical protein